MKKVHIDLNKHKKEIIIGCIFLIAIVACIVFLFVNGDDSGNNIENNGENIANNVKSDDVDSTKVTEKDIMDVYSFSKEDAKKLVSSAFNSDNFEYTVIVGDDGKYIVKVKNTINDNIYRFEVDPATKTYVEI